MKKFFNYLFWKSKPLMTFIDKTFTMPYSIKKIKGEHYYLWRDDIWPGTAFLTNVFGVGSNLINPAEMNHAAIYFGNGLLSYLTELIHSLEREQKISESESNSKLLKRLKKTIKDYNLSDDIKYVIEATGSGVHPTDLVSFMLTKDEIRILRPKFSSIEGMEQASREAVLDLGLPYDFGFSDDEGYKYCFEVVADSYSKIMPDIKLKKKEYKILGYLLYDTFLADTFLDENNWEIVIDSNDYVK